MENAQAPVQSGKGILTDIEITPDGYKVRRVCQDRIIPPAGAKDITLSINKYRPFEQFNAETYAALNMTGWKLGSIEIRSGSVYPSYDGKRLVLEVGCTTVVYLQIGSGAGGKHHRFFIQSHTDFLMDITTRAVAAHVSRAGEAVQTIAKYEIYFLMGVFSTLGIVAWLAVTGSDVTVSSILAKKKVKAFGALAKSLLKELENIKTYAPTLHKKLVLLINAEKEKLQSDTARNTPKAVATDEKAQAQVAGILFGKYFFSPKLLNVWAALTTVLVQAGTKSITNIPDSASKSIDDRYASVVRSLANTNWDDMSERMRAIQKVVAILKEANVPISASELEKIIKEVKRNPDKLQNSLININNAIKIFQQNVG